MLNFIRNSGITRAQVVAATAAAAGLTTWGISTLIANGTFGVGSALFCLAAVAAETALGLAAYHAAPAAADAAVQAYDDRIDGDYRPEFGPDREDTYGMRSGPNSRFQRNIAAETQALAASLADTQAGSYTQASRLASVPVIGGLFRQEQPVRYTLAPINPADIAATQEGVTRRGTAYRRQNQD